MAKVLWIFCVRQHSCGCKNSVPEYDAKVWDFHVCALVCLQSVKSCLHVVCLCACKALFASELALARQVSLLRFEFRFSFSIVMERLHLLQTCGLRKVPSLRDV